MYDAKNVIIYSLVAFCSLLLISTIFFYATPRVETVTKTKIVKSTDYDPIKVRNWLLRDGIEFAWVEQVTPNLKADCFKDWTRPEDGISVFSYCSLRNK